MAMKTMLSAFCRWGNWSTEFSDLQKNTQLINTRVKFKPVFLSPNPFIIASSFHGYGARSTSISKAWLWSFQLCLGENPTSQLPWGQSALWATESAYVTSLLILTCLEIPVDLGLRERASDMCLSSNQVGHVGRRAFLVVFLYFFSWPQVKHRITMEHFYRGKRKRSMEILLHLQRSVAWANFYSGAHLICVSSPSLCMCTGRLVANICFDRTRFPSEHSRLVQEKKRVLPTTCWYCFPSIKLSCPAGYGG